MNPRQQRGARCPYDLQDTGKSATRAFFVSVILLVTGMLLLVGCTSLPETATTPQQNLTVTPALTPSAQPPPTTATSISSFATPTTSSGPASHQDVTLELVGQLGGRSVTVAVQGQYAYLGVGPRLAVVDIANPRAPRLVAQSAVLPGFVAAVVVRERYAYLANGSQLAVIDVLDPHAPKVLGQSGALPGTIQGIAIAGHYAYLMTSECVDKPCFRRSGKLTVLDAANPAALTAIGSLDIPGSIPVVYGGLVLPIVDGYVYVAAGTSGLRVIDASDPARLREVASLAIPGGAQDVAVMRGHAYVATEMGSLHVVDVTVPANPREIAAYTAITGLHVSRVAAVDGYAYILHRSRLIVIDVTNPANPREVGSTGADELALAVVGGYAYLAKATGGLLVIDVTDPSKPQQVGAINTSGPSRAFDLALAQPYAYVTTLRSLHLVNVADAANPRETGSMVLNDSGGIAVSEGYAYVTAWEDGIAIVDVTDPAHPRQASRLALKGQNNHIAVAGHYAYVAAGTGGLRVVDITNPAEPREVGAYNSFGLFVLAVKVIGSHAYLLGGASGTDQNFLQIMDVSDPSKPSAAGRLPFQRAARNLAVAGGYAYVARQECNYLCSGSLLVIDVSEPTRPRHVGSLATQGGAFDVALMGSNAYVAVGNCGEGECKGKMGSLQIIDVTSPTTPREVGIFDTPGLAIGVMVAGDYAYVANYDGGLLILRITRR